MQEAYIRSNPLIRSVIHKTFQRAVRDIGLPEFPLQALMAEITPYLRIQDSLFDDDEVSRQKVAGGILRGEVIATEVQEDDVLAFYVRGYVGRKAVDVRLTCRKHAWHVESVISMHTDSITRSRWFYQTSLLGAVVVAGLVGYALHPSTRSVQQPLAVQTSSPGQVNAPTNAPSKASVQNSTTSKTDSPNVTAGQTPAAQSPSKVNDSDNATVRFTLKQGMPLYNLASFLQTHHLVHNAMAFDMLMKKTKVDRNLKPGTFIFKAGMSEQQIIQVLQRGPSKS